MYKPKRKKYRIGTKDKNDFLEEDTQAKKPAENRDPFDKYVTWPVGNNDWKSTSDIQATIGISRYYLTRNPGGYLYDFLLVFTNTENYNFYFCDNEIDCYQCNCYRKKDHYVEYNSKRPDIQRVTGDM